MLHTLLTLTLGPVLLVQGRAVRRDTPILPEPPGDRHGTAGDGPPLRLLILGDSAAAGVGAAHQDDALLGHVVAALTPHHRITWTLHAVTGATTQSTLNDLHHLEGQTFDVAITSLGVNDITSGVGRATWRRQQQELRSRLKNHLEVQWLIASGLPPVEGFPALPQPLRWYLGRRAREFDRDLQRDVAEEADTEFLSLRFSEDASLMASDGFHPGPGVYAECGRRAGALATKVPPPT